MKSQITFKKCCHDNYQKFKYVDGVPMSDVRFVLAATHVATDAMF